MGKREDGQRSPDEWGDDSFWWGVSWFDKAVVPAVTFQPAEGHSPLCSSLSVGLINFSENCLTAYTEISPGLLLNLASSLSTLLILSFHTGPCRQAAPDPGEDGVKQTGPRRVYKAPRATDKRAWGGKRTDKARERAREGTENSSQTGIGSSGIACFSERAKCWRCCSEHWHSCSFCKVHGNVLLQRFTWLLSHQLRTFLVPSAPSAFLAVSVQVSAQPLALLSSVGWASTPVQAGCAGNLAVLLPPATCLCSGLHLCDLAVTALILSLLSWQNGAYKSKRSRNARGRRRSRRDQTSSAVQSWCSRRPGAWLSRATAAGSSAARKSS